MAKIIGNEYTITCSRCRNVIEYDFRDVYKEMGGRFKYYQIYSKCIKCPCCGNGISLGVYRDFYSQRAQEEWRHQNSNFHCGVEDCY